MQVWQHMNTTPKAIFRAKSKDMSFDTCKMELDAALTWLLCSPELRARGAARVDVGVTVGRRDVGAPRRSVAVFAVCHRSGKGVNISELVPPTLVFHFVGHAEAKDCSFGSFCCRFTWDLCLKEPAGFAAVGAGPLRVALSAFCPATPRLVVSELASYSQ